MPKLTSAKWVILLTVLINVVTTFTVLTIFPSGMWMANAAKPINCTVNNTVMHAFKSGGAYSGDMRANSGGNKVIATMSIAFYGSAPKSKSDRGNLTRVDFNATATTNNKFNFSSLQGAGLVKSVTTALADFTVKLSGGGKIHFVNGAFTGQGQQIVGTFDISGGPDNHATGSWVVK